MELNKKSNLKKTVAENAAEMEMEKKSDFGK